MRRVFLVNRLACDGKSGPFWDSVEHHFRDAFPDMEVRYPDSGKSGMRMASEIAASGEPTCIVTVGGEGTMNRALNGIMQSGHRDQVSMALVPFGNVNDYGANIGLKKTWQHALQALQANKLASVGVVRVTADDKTEYALNIADIGFGASTAKCHSVDHQLSWLKGQFKYNMLALKTLLRWKNIPARITIDDKVITGDVAILLSGFSRTLGGFYLVPHASPVSDNMAVSFGLNPGKLKILQLIEASKKNKLKEDDIIHFDRARRIMIEGTAPMVVEVDGEIVSTGSRKILFEAMPRAVRFVVPPDSALVES